MMKNWIIRNRLYGIGAIVGAKGGFLYWEVYRMLNQALGAIPSNPIRKHRFILAASGALVF